MARLNARQKRAAKVRLTLHDLAISRNPTTQAPKVLSKVFTQGDIRSSDQSFRGSAHKAPVGTYKVAAVRPTIKTGKRKSGAVERVADLQSVTPNPTTHNHGDRAVIPARVKTAKRWGIKK